MLPALRVDTSLGDRTPEWGMHFVDANVALQCHHGDIDALVTAQAGAYASDR